MQETAREVAEDVVNVMSELADMLSDSLEIGDPPAKVHMGKMTLDVSKQRANVLAKEEPTTHIGSLAAASCTG